MMRIEGMETVDAIPGQWNYCKSRGNAITGWIMLLVSIEGKLCGRLILRRQ